MNVKSKQYLWEKKSDFPCDSVQEWLNKWHSFLPFQFYFTLFAAFNPDEPSTRIKAQQQGEVIAQWILLNEVFSCPFILNKL